MDVAALAALITVPITLAGVVAAVYFSTRQVRLTGIQSLSPVALDAFREARTPEWFVARDWIMQNLPSDEYPPMKGVSEQTEPLRGRIRTVGFFYDNLGVFVAHGIVTEDLIIGFFGNGMAEVWRLLRPYIRAEANLRKMEYMAYFEDLVARAEARSPANIYDDLGLRRATNRPIKALRTDQGSQRPDRSGPTTLSG